MYPTMSASAQFDLRLYLLRGRATQVQHAELNFTTACYFTEEETGVTCKIMKFTNSLDN